MTHSATPRPLQLLNTLTDEETSTSLYVCVCVWWCVCACVCGVVCGCRRMILFPESAAHMRLCVLVSTIISVFMGVCVCVCVCVCETVGADVFVCVTHVDTSSCLHVQGRACPSTKSLTAQGLL